MRCGFREKAARVPVRWRRRSRYLRPLEPEHAVAARGVSVVARLAERRGRPRPRAPPHQSPSPSKSAPAGKTPEEIQAIKERVADWLKTCLSDWDRATHMTSVEWRTTCQRVAADRPKFLLEDP